MNYVETRKAEVLLKIPVPQRETQERCHQFKKVWTWRKTRVGLEEERVSVSIKGRMVCTLQS